MVTLNLNYPDVLQLFLEHIVPNRNESAAFLIWYLQNYYNLDTLEAQDSVCDKKYDKGVDGIYVNENDLTITIFQSKLSSNEDKTIGDTILKKFSGTIKQFETRRQIEALINDSQIAVELVQLIKRLDLLSKIEDGYELRGEFVVNSDLDDNGKTYLQHEPRIVFVGKTELLTNFISPERTSTPKALMELDIAGAIPTHYAVENGKTEAIIIPIRASELLKLEGIANQSLFAFNVRGPMGRTKVNREIVRSIKTPEFHKYFPFFHNGITIICNTLDTSDPQKVVISDYYVVNGCQSLTSMHQNQQYVTDELFILAKIIQVDVKSDLSSNITQFSNTQNGVKQRDLKSNHPVQIRLKNQFIQDYSNLYHLEIKTGEELQTGEKITNELAGLYLWSFDLKSPWDTHRKYQVFDEKYTEIFCRPEVTADRIVMCHVIMLVIEQTHDQIENRLFAKYVLTKHILLYTIRTILEKDPLGLSLIENPSKFVRDSQQRNKFSQIIKKLLETNVIVDLNFEIKGLDEDFDYRGKTRDKLWVTDLVNKIFASYTKDIRRKKAITFEKEWGNGA